MQASRNRFVVYVALVFALSVPFWIAGAAWKSFLPHWLPIALPASALMAFMPAGAALMLEIRRGGTSAARALLVRAFDVQRIRAAPWLATAFVFMPAVLAVAFVLQRAAGAPMDDVHVPLLMAPLMFAIFFIAAAGEEIGWQGFAYDELERRFPVLESALLIGAVWAVWHIVPYVQTGHDWSWVVWQCVVTLFLRVVTVWLYVYGGRSVFIASVFHAMTNVGMFLFPNYGSFYDPATTAVVLACVTAFMAALWGARMVQERV